MLPRFLFLKFGGILRPAGGRGRNAGWGFWNFGEGGYPEIKYKIHSFVYHLVPKRDYPIFNQQLHMKKFMVLLC